MTVHSEVRRAMAICEEIANHAEEVAKLRIELVVISRALVKLTPEPSPEDDMPTSPGTPTSKSQQFKAVNVTKHLEPHASERSKGRY